MARKIKTVRITEEGRDKGKTFFITEMPTTKAEKWAMRAFLAMARSGIDIPDEITKAGLAGLATFALRAVAGLNFVEAEPLMDEMMHCVQLQPDPLHPEVLRALIPDDIDEVKTLFTLRKEVMELHTGFSVPAAPLTSE